MRNIAEKKGQGTILGNTVFPPTLAEALDMSQWEM